METENLMFPWLSLVDRPAFCVKDGVVAALNTAAENRMLRIGMDVREIVTEHRDAYEKFESGCLYLTIRIGGLPCNAGVARTRECDVFFIMQDSDDDQLQTLALAAQQLRIPLSNVMTVTDRMLSDLSEADPVVREHANQLNHSLFQLLRVISNMSDAGSYGSQHLSGMETVDLIAVIDEIMEKARTHAAGTGIEISYASPGISVFGLANSEKLERAVYNLLSNALKFSPAGSTVDVKLTRNGNLLSLTVCNPNAEPVNDHSFWSRYRREPAIEDSRYGLGLGMTLVSAAASAHGGTVLVDHPSPSETRVTMTIAIVSSQDSAVHSPVIRIGDYAGGRDKALLELAEILPPASYENIN